MCTKTDCGYYNIDVDYISQCACHGAARIAALGSGARGPQPVASCRGAGAGWVALLVQRYLSNTASYAFYGIACLIRRIEFATFFAAFE